MKLKVEGGYLKEIHREFNLEAASMVKEHRVALSQAVRDLNYVRRHESHLTASVCQGSHDQDMA
jgi:hypothetical protein